eukprot:2036579-Rhodomonas_salina.1
MGEGGEGDGALGSVDGALLHSGAEPEHSMSTALVEAATNLFALHQDEFRGIPRFPQHPRVVQRKTPTQGIQKETTPFVKDANAATKSIFV